MQRYDPKKMKLIKVGGYGSIYLGYDDELRVPVVLKKIHVGKFDIEKQEKIARDDALITSQLKGHPNIVEVNDIKKSKTGEYTIIMEYIDGYNIFDFRKRLKGHSKKLPYDFSLYIISQVCEGLEFAHNKKIIHRDISPSNIMVSNNGYVKIIDFGIAKAEIFEQSHTETGLIKGKLPYMAPEQIQALEYDHRIDIYSTGIILYELIIGHSLYEQKDKTPFMKLMQQISNREIDLNAQFAKYAVPENIQRILFKALAINPDDRYLTALEMQIDILEVISNKSETSLRRELKKFLIQISEPFPLPKAAKKQVKDSDKLTSSKSGGTDRDKSTIPSLEKKYMILRFKHYINQLDIKVKEENEYLRKHPRSDPVVRVQNLDLWAIERKIEQFVTIDIEDNEITLKVNKYKLDRFIKSDEKKKTEEEAEADEARIERDESKDRGGEDRGKREDKEKEKEKFPRKSGDEISERPPVTQPFNIYKKFFSKKLFTRMAAGIIVFLIVAGIAWIVYNKIGMKESPGYVSVMVTSFPDGAHVMLNNQEYGKTPRIVSIPVDTTTTIMLGRKGFSPIITEVNSNNMTDPLHFVFHKNVKVFSDFPQTRITANDVIMNSIESVADWRIDQLLVIRASLTEAEPLTMALQYPDDGNFSGFNKEFKWLRVSTVSIVPELVFEFKHGIRIEFISYPEEGARYRDGEGKMLEARIGVKGWFPFSYNNKEIIFDMENYQDFRQPISVRPNSKNLYRFELKKEEPDGEDIPSPPPPPPQKNEIVLSITVRTSAGEPVPMANIIIILNNQRMEEITDSNGKKELLLAADPGDRLDVRIRKAGYDTGLGKIHFIKENKKEYEANFLCNRRHRARILERAFQYWKDGKHEEAIAEFKQIEGYSNNSEFEEYKKALKGIGDIYRETKKLEDAISYYENILKLDPYDPFTWFFLGQCYFNSKNYAKALDSFEKVQPNIREIYKLDERKRMQVRASYFNALSWTLYIRKDVQKIRENKQLETYKNNALLKWEVFQDITYEVDNQIVSDITTLIEEANRNIQYLRAL